MITIKSVALNLWRPEGSLCWVSNNEELLFFFLIIWPQNQIWAFFSSVFFALWALEQQSHSSPVRENSAIYLVECGLMGAADGGWSHLFLSQSHSAQWNDEESILMERLPLSSEWKHLITLFFSNQSFCSFSECYRRFFQTLDYNIMDTEQI